MQRVGVIGLGKMGLPIARNLMERGFAVIGYRRSGSAELAKAGGQHRGLRGRGRRAGRRPAVDRPGHRRRGRRRVRRHRHAGRPAPRHRAHRDEHRRCRAQERHPGRGPAAWRRHAGLPDQRQPGHGWPRLATTFVSGERASVQKVRAVLDAISGPWVYTGAFGTGARLKYIANLLLAVHPWRRPRPWNWPGAAASTWTSCSAPWTTRSAVRRSGGSAAR